MELNRDFSEFIACFEAHEVRYLIVGGYAVAAHGHPRYTKDLDVRVRVDTENRMLAEFGETQVPVIGRAELRRNRLATRRRDLADLEDLGIPRSEDTEDEPG